MESFSFPVSLAEVRNNGRLKSAYSSQVGTHLLAMWSRPGFPGLCVFVLSILRQVSGLCEIKLDYINPFSVACPAFVVRLD